MGETYGGIDSFVYPDVCLEFVLLLEDLEALAALEYLPVEGLVPAQTHGRGEQGYATLGLGCLSRE